MRLGNPWTVDEFALVVEEYARLLVADTAGAPIHKANTARELAECIGRTRCAVEYVWGNVSAILELWGQPWLQGAPPRAHWNRALPEIVADVFGI